MLFVKAYMDMKTSRRLYLRLRAAFLRQREIWQARVLLERIREQGTDDLAF